MDTPPGHLRLAPGISVPLGALAFATSRSSGPGGQNVNRTESRVELRLVLGAIVGLAPRAADRLAQLAGERLTGGGELLLVCEETRSQRRNRELVLERLAELVGEARAVPRTRRPTKPSYGSKQRRLEDKKAHSTKKSARSWSE